MQTFLPYKDFDLTARCLDNKRLGKQRVEVLQILNALYGVSAGWKNHPATKMWKGSEEWLVVYGVSICNEWKARGFKDTCADKIRNFWHNKACESNFPQWLQGNDSPICVSHRAALLYKNIQFYSKFGWKEKPQINYYWPTKQ